MNRGTVNRNRVDLHNNSVAGSVDVTKTGPKEWNKEQRVNAQSYNSPSSSIASLGTVAGTAPYYRSHIQLFDGRVMFIPNGNITATNNPVRFYDPATNTTTTRSYTIQKARTAVLLNDGRVYLIPISSTTAGVSASRAYLFNPINETFITSSATYEAVNTAVNSSQRCATLLPSGEVFVLGSGSAGRGAYIYNPVNDSLRIISSAPTVGGWTTTLLLDGRVYCFPLSGAAPTTYQTAYIYNPANDTFATASTAGAAFANFNYARALTMTDGRVLVTPGDGGTGSYYNPNTNTFSTAFLTTAAANFSRGAVLLRDNTVYIVPNNTVGGGGRIFNPRTGTVTNGPGGYDGQNNADAFVMYDGRVFLGAANGTTYAAYGGTPLPVAQFLPPTRVHSPYNGNRVSNTVGA